MESFEEFNMRALEEHEWESVPVTFITIGTIIAGMITLLIAVVKNS